MMHSPGVFHISRIVSCLWSSYCWKDWGRVWIWFRSESEDGLAYVLRVETFKGQDGMVRNSKSLLLVANVGLLDHIDEQSLSLLTPSSGRPAVIFLFQGCTLTIP